MTAYLSVDLFSVLFTSFVVFQQISIAMLISFYAAHSTLCSFSREERKASYLWSLRRYTTIRQRYKDTTLRNINNTMSREERRANDEREMKLACDVMEGFGAIVKEVS